MLSLSAAVLAQALASTAALPATQPPTLPAPSIVVTHEWYGYETLPIDVAALALVEIGFAKLNTALFVAGAFLYPIGAPIVHLAHGRPLLGLVDLSVRTALDLLLAVPIAALGDIEPTGTFAFNGA